jgi:hypothetical protein
MAASVLLPGLTSVLALVLAVALLDQWRDRRAGFQLIWATGMLFFGIASGCEALAAAGGWNEGLYRTWYLTGAVWTAGWLGLGIFTVLTQRRFGYAGSGSAPVLYLIGALVLALAVAVETYFQNERWPILAAGGVAGATVLSIVLMVTTVLPAPGYALNPTTGVPVADLFPGTLRLLTPFLNVTGGLALALGALFSAYVFMPKRRVLAYSLDPNQPGDHFLFNLLISPVAIVVNFVASLPHAIGDLVRGRLHSRVPATILIATGGFLASGGDTLTRFGVTEFFHLAKFLSVLFLLAGFLVSVEAFREIRIPFTSIRLATARHERVPVEH